MFKAEKDYYSKLFDQQINNTKIIWQNINRLFNKKSNEDNCVERLDFNGTIISNPIEISESFNSYFCNVGIDLAKKFASTGPMILNSIWAHLLILVFSAAQ